MVDRSMGGPQTQGLKAEAVERLTGHGLGAATHAGRQGAQCFFCCSSLSVFLSFCLFFCLSSERGSAESAFKVSGFRIHERHALLEPGRRHVA